jgi:hypothetical protein
MNEAQILSSKTSSRVNGSIAAEFLLGPESSSECALVSWTNSPVVPTQGQIGFSAPESITQLVQSEERNIICQRYDPDTDEELDKDCFLPSPFKEAKTTKVIKKTSNLDLLDESLVSPMTEFSPCRKALMF